MKILRRYTLVQLRGVAWDIIVSFYSLLQSLLFYTQTKIVYPLNTCYYNSKLKQSRVNYKITSKVWWEIAKNRLKKEI